MSHHEEEAPKMVKKTSSSYELNSDDNLETGQGKGETVCANVVHSGRTSANTRISKGDNSSLIGLTIEHTGRITKCS